MRKKRGKFPRGRRLEEALLRRKKGGELVTQAIWKTLARERGKMASRGSSQMQRAPGDLGSERQQIGAV